MLELRDFQTEIVQAVRFALAEDIRDGDLTARLVPPDQQATGRVITREDCVVAGRPWVDETFAQLDPDLQIEWQVGEGRSAAAGAELFRIHGNARALLTGERTALNFLQTISGTASRAAEYAALVRPATVRLLDTRKTLPGLRIAQKYGVSVGGCHNHRLGLWDAFLIKENHIAACGSIAAAVTAARGIAPGKTVEVEVENPDELEQALNAGADIVMLDDFGIDDIRAAVSSNQGRAKLEISGGVNERSLPLLAATGVDYISIGALTKHVRAIDLSMRLEVHP